MRVPPSLVLVVVLSGSLLASSPRQTPQTVFRGGVNLVNVTAMCGASTPGWIYLNSDDSNYSTYVATILMAKAQGTPLTFFAVRESDGYCHLGHLAMP